MADIEQFLTKKAGPFPVWVWAVGGGGLASILFLYKRGGAAPGASMSDASQTGPYSPSPIIVTPGTMPDSTSSMNPPPSLTPSNMVTLQGSHGVVWLHASPNGNGGVVAVLPNGTPLPSAGSPVQGQSFTDSGLTSNYWQPVKYSGATVYAWGPEAQASSGMGGASTVKLLSGGGKVGRFNSPHAHHQYLNVTGMGGGKGNTLRRISRKTGIPLIRLHAVNPGHWRPGSGQHDSVVRIA